MGEIQDLMQSAAEVAAESAYARMKKEHEVPEGYDFYSWARFRMVNTIIIWAADKETPTPVTVEVVYKFLSDYADVESARVAPKVVLDMFDEYTRTLCLCGLGHLVTGEVVDCEYTDEELAELDASSESHSYKSLPHYSPREVRGMVLSRFIE